MTISPERLAVTGPCVHFDSGVPALELLGLAERGFALRDLDGAAIAGRDDLLAALASALAFPDYFGGNWDALDEVLRDLGWLPADGYVLVVRDATALWREAPRAAGRLVESWLFCAEEWSRRETPFHLVFDWSQP